MVGIWFVDICTSRTAVNHGGLCPFISCLLKSLMNTRKTKTPNLVLDTLTTSARLMTWKNLLVKLISTSQSSRHQMDGVERQKSNLFNRLTQHEQIYFTGLHSRFVCYFTTNWGTSSPKTSSPQPSSTSLKTPGCTQRSTRNSFLY